MSNPNVFEFDPRPIAWQYKTLKDMRKNFDYGKGSYIDENGLKRWDRICHEIMMSGSVGSAKSILAAHMAVTHCMMYPKARVLLGRLSMPDLKDTILAKILEHLDDALIRGKDYKFNVVKSSITFRNGSEIISRSWHDKNFKSKFRSLELSAAVIEELTENDGDYWDFYKELRMRVQRLPEIPECWILCATNPDSPSHPAYDYFIQGSEKFDTRHVYYSVTTDNPFLPDNYVEQLLQDLDPLTAQRMIYGKWIYINVDVIYHQYKSQYHFKDHEYKIKLNKDIKITFDFNIGQGKPMSCVLFQHRGGVFHFFNQSVIEGADTEEIMVDLANRGLLDLMTTYVIHGDATGRARNSANKQSNYDVISQFLDTYRTKDGRKVVYSIDVPTINPPVRTRHNLVNGYMKNCHGQIRVAIYKDCPVLDDGFRKTKLKKGGAYIEDDSKAYQHATTAAGYGIYYVHEFGNNSSRLIEFG